MSLSHVLSDRLLVGIMSSKVFVELLLPKIDNQWVIRKWEEDLECTIEDLWEKVSCKANLIFDSYLRDFHIQFLNTALQYNLVISSYRPSQSPLCGFCKIHAESYKHLFWECIYVVPIWTAIQDFCYDTVDTEDFKCLLLELSVSLTLFNYDSC